MKRVGIVLGLIVLIMVFVGITQNSSNGKKEVALGNYALTIAEARLASAKYALDGTGSFTEDQCNKLGELAKKFSSSADYIECTGLNLIYLATPDTTDKYILTLSDNNYTATFTTDKKMIYLTDYSFSNTPSGGFNKYGGRK